MNEILENDGKTGWCGTFSSVVKYMNGIRYG